MDHERLKIFDDNGNEIGVATREEVHRIGHWHEAFHCWFLSREGGKGYIYLQLRSKLKKDYPNLLDITAAGHLLANEKVLDGVREIHEEIGIDVPIQELLPLGTIKYCVTKPGFTDKELAHVYLYIGENILGKAVLQKEEVSGIVRAEFQSFCQLWLGLIDRIRVEGYEIIDDIRIPISQEVQRDRFVPHDKSYYEDIVKLIASQI
ncbi:NUDIX hydrolase [Paenibacillus kobensis]|uniref:NUDIX hydrolase n=1 Tax=Paenibacillus kobensis TaxID=59841 RepID=UPI000FD91529|nr:NUDIX domain-containing protein [Paenibacillus kobensis]